MAFFSGRPSPPPPPPPSWEERELARAGIEAIEAMLRELPPLPPLSRWQRVTRRWSDRWWTVKDRVRYLVHGPEEESEW